MHPYRVAMHPVPMPFERKEHSLLHTDGAKHAPAIQQTNLAGRQALLMRVQDLVVVDQEAMHILILTRARRPAYSTRSSVRRRVSLSVPARPEFGAGPNSSLPLSKWKKRFCSVPT